MRVQHDVFPHEEASVYSVTMHPMYQPHGYYTNFIGFIGDTVDSLIADLVHLTGCTVGYRERICVCSSYAAGVHRRVSSC
jgi:hypothetical protein